MAMMNPEEETVIVEIDTTDPIDVNDKLGAGIRFFNTNQERKCVCKPCLRTCNSLSQFIRHVTHSKLCKSIYEPDFILGMKQASREKSKREWVWANWEEVKAKQKNNERKYYVTNKVRLSQPGRAFYRLFYKVFDEQFKAAKEKIENYGRQTSFLTASDIEKALDKTFQNGLFDVIIEERGNDDDDLLENVFSKLESWFEKECQSIDRDKSYHWRKQKHWLFSDGLMTYCKNKAYLDVYKEEEFTALVEEALDEALDEVFLNRITLEGYFKGKDLEYELENAVMNGVLHERVAEKSINNGTQGKIDDLIKQIFKKRFIGRGLKNLLEK